MMIFNDQLHKLLLLNWKKLWWKLFNLHILSVTFV